MRNTMEHVNEETIPEKATGGTQWVWAGLGLAALAAATWWLMAKRHENEDVDKLFDSAENLLDRLTA
ncbi:MAG: hypothetical protein ACK5XS_02295 [Armatimonadota bacterium]|nr:hypothetical protein CCB81_12745 [Armatimonadetes bacterium Uphvl-Ar2]MCE2939163.1 hypothetical protein [Fimbriimonadaceae bacterium]HAY13211.1 hypothetical protein [Armatimonadota bacterium]HCM72898.1 hypothetical protein [Armatimonadota bacterium]